MTDQPPEKAPAPAGPVPPARQEAPVPAAAPQDPQARMAELQAELTKARAALVRDAKVMLRVLAPHDSFTYGGVTVGEDPTPVPAVFVARLQGAAADAGVKLEEA